MYSLKKYVHILIYKRLGKLSSVVDHKAKVKQQFTLPGSEVERGGSVVECRTPEREVGGSKPTAAVLCP